MHEARVELAAGVYVARVGPGHRLRALLQLHAQAGPATIKVTGYPESLVLFCIVTRYLRMRLLGSTV